MLRWRRSPAGWASRAVPEDDRGETDNATAATGLTWRKRVHDILELGSNAPLAVAINAGLIVLILLNALAFAAETVPELGARYAGYFRAFDTVSVLIFTIEYGLRLWSCVDAPVLAQNPPWRARLHFAGRPLMLIDLAAILPFYLSFLFALDLRVLRVLRLFRFLKLARYSPAIQALGRVIAMERRSLLGALLLMMTLLLFAATGLYLVEREAQPEAFGSIPAAAWWALATLTTVGYGDVVPITPLGKLFGGIVMIFGLGMFALPIAIVATGFSEQAHRRDFVVTWGMVARVPLFAQLEATAVAQIMSLLYARSYAEGGRIIREGDEADAMYFITSGLVTVDLESGPVSLGEGDFFGEIALIQRRAHAHNVTAATKCRLLVLDKDDFERLCHREPDVRAHIRGVAEAREKIGATKMPAPPGNV